MGTHPIFESDFDCLTDRVDILAVSLISKGIKRLVWNLLFLKSKT